MSSSGFSLKTVSACSELWEVEEQSYRLVSSRRWPATVVAHFIHATVKKIIAFFKNYFILLGSKNHSGMHPYNIVQHFSGC